jgi:hypothetical protein
MVEKDLNWVIDPELKEQLAKAYQQYEEDPSLENLYRCWGLSDSIYLKQNPEEASPFSVADENDVSVLDSYF